MKYIRNDPNSSGLFVLHILLNSSCILPISQIARLVQLHPESTILCATCWIVTIHPLLPPEFIKESYITNANWRIGYPSLDISGSIPSFRQNPISFSRTNLITIIEHYKPNHCSIEIRMSRNHISLHSPSLSLSYNRIQCCESVTQIELDGLHWPCLKIPHITRWRFFRCAPTRDGWYEEFIYRFHAWLGRPLMR